MRRRGIKKGPNNHRGDEEDDSGCNSESRNILAVPVDDYDNLTDCEEFYDDDTDDVKRRSSHCFSASEDDRNGEYLTDIEYSSDEDDCPSKQPETSSQVPRRSAKEISLYIQRVLGRPLRAVTCFKEREQGGTLIQTEQVDCEDEATDDEASRCDELPVDIPESSPDSEMSDIEASDIDSDTEDDTDRSHNNNESNIIDDYLQGHFARLSSTDHDSRGKRNSEIDESLLAPGIVVSKCGEHASDASHPVTEEEILSEREVSHKPANVRSKRRITRGQFAKQSNYLTASLPTVGQGETDSESESDGRQFIRSSFQQYNSRSMNQDDDVSPEAQDNLSNLPSTDSESFELEDEDAPLNDDFQSDSASVESEKRPKDVKIVSQISSEEIID